MKIRETRETVGLTLAEVAKRLGISKGQYAQIEDETIEPTASQLLNLANIFGVSVDFLLEHSTPISQGEKTWLNIRKSLPEDKLKTVAQMLNGVNDLELNDDDINSICNVENDKLTDCDNDARMKRLFNIDDGDDELTFDDYLVLKKINDGEDIHFMSKDADTLKTNYSFTYEGKFYSSKEVTKILLRLDRKFELLGYYFVFSKTKKGYETSDEFYFELNKKGKSLLKAKEAELKG